MKKLFIETFGFILLLFGTISLYGVVRAIGHPLPVLETLGFIWYSVSIAVLGVAFFKHSERAVKLRWFIAAWCVQGMLVFDVLQNDSLVWKLLLMSLWMGMLFSLALPCTSTLFNKTFKVFGIVFVPETKQQETTTNLLNS